MRPVRDDIPDDADILVVGEAPGHQEVIDNRPFVGTSGRLLFNDILSRAGIPRTRCAVTNVVTIKPPDNNLSRLHELDVNVDDFLDHLEQIVRMRRWSIILAVGELAMNTLTGYSSITKYHGSLLYDKYTGTRTVPMIHPAAILRQYEWLTWARLDAKKIKFYIDTNTQHPPKRALTTQFSLPNYEDFYNELCTYRQSPIISFDIETFNGTITAIGLADSAYRAISVPIAAHFSDEQCRELVKVINEILRGPSLKIAQNAIYDITYLRDLGIAVNNMWMDTMIAHHCIWAELPHGLDFLCAQYTIEPYYKDMRKEAMGGEYTQAAQEYNALDACITYEVAMKLEREMHKYFVYRFYIDKVLPFFCVVCRMQLRGITIDESIRKSLVAEVDTDITNAKLTLTEVAGQEINANSHKQVKDYLRLHHFSIPLNRRSGAESANETALRTIARKNPQAKLFVNALLRVRELTKLASFLRAEQEPDGTMKTFYNLAGTVTGRLSSGTNIWGRGANLQNQPDFVRGMYVAKPENILLQFDLKAAEDRVVAYISGDRNQVDSYRRGLDGHCVMATILFGVAYDDIFTGYENGNSTYTDMRYLAKRCRHAWNYGMAARKMTEVIQNDRPDLAWSMQDSTNAIETLNHALPGVVAWRYSVRERVQRERCLVNCFGRRRVFLGRMTDDLYREAYAFGPQSTVVDHLDFALAEIERALPSDAKLILQVHDSIVIECPHILDTTHQVTEIVRSYLERPLPITYEGEQLVIPTDVKIGRSWRDVS